MNLTDLFSALGMNYSGNSTTDEQARQAQIAQEREAYLARMQQYAQVPDDQTGVPLEQRRPQYEFGQAKAQREVEKLLALRDQNYQQGLGGQLAETVGMVVNDLQEGAPIRRALTPLDATPEQRKGIAAGSQLVSALGQAIVGGRMPLPKNVAKSIPKPMSFAPEEASLITKASGAKPIYGAAQKGTVAKGMTASPAQLKSMTDLQASVGGDVGSALQTERAVPMRGQTLNQAQKVAQKASGTLNITGSDGTVIGTEGKVIKELGEQGGIKYKQVEYTDPTTGKRTISSVPENLIQDTATKPTTPKVGSKPVPVAQAEVPKTKWQQVKKGVGSAAKVAGIGGTGYMLGRNWDENAGLPAQPAPAAPAAPEQSLEQYIAGFDLNKADKLVMPQQQSPAQAQEPSFLEKLLQQVLTQSQPSQREGSLTEEQLLQRMESMMNQPQPPPPQVPDNKPKSTLGMVMDALGRGLIAGGTGQADPDAAQKLEMERMTTNQNLAQNARKLTPQQEMTMQMLQSLLGNKMQQGNIAQQGAQSQQNALIQAIVASQLGSQQTAANQQFTASQNQLNRDSDERIAGVRASAAAQKAAAIQQLLESLSLGGAQAPAGPQVNFGQ